MRDDSLRELCLADPIFSQRYEGWSVLGTGTYATVVGVRSRDAGRDIALKIFHGLSPADAERVRAEVHAAQSLATPYFVQVYSVFDRGSLTWFEMELVEGPNLDQELDRLGRDRRRIAIPRAIDVSLAIARCLWHAHRRGVLHRDVKPANVLLPYSRTPPAYCRTSTHAPTSPRSCWRWSRPSASARTSKRRRPGRPARADPWPFRLKRRVSGCRLPTRSPASERHPRAERTP
jgi:serine/threonine protein kinase